MILKRGETELSVEALYPCEIDSLPHQNKGVSANDTTRVYNRGVHAEIITIPIMTQDDSLDALRTFIRLTLLFSLYEFYIIPDAGHDIGNGSGGAIKCRWWGDSFTETRIAYGVNNHTLIVKRTDVQPWSAGNFADDIDMPEELSFIV